MRFALALSPIAALAARITVFQEGGTVGAWACTVIFYGSLVAYLVLCLREDVLNPAPERKGMKLRWFLLAILVATLVPLPFSVPAWASDAARIYMLVALPTIVGLSVRAWMHRRRVRPA
jgi:hypothetical protein